MKNSVIYKSLLFAILATLASSCEKIIEPKDLPEQDPRLVLNSVLETDSLIKVSVTASKSIISGKNYKIINDAVCELYINGQYKEQLKNISDTFYLSTYSAKTNNSYLLKVRAPGYKDVEGSTTLPGIIKISRTERYDTTTYNISRSGNPGNTNIFGTIKFKLYIKDNLTKSNYYGISPVIVLYDSLNKKIDTQLFTYITNNNINQLSGNFSADNRSLESDDKFLVNGDEVLFDASINISNAASSSITPYYAEINFIVSGYSEELYKYKVTLDQQSSVSGGLFSEPVLVFSNITNGMGIVGSINTQIISAGKVNIKKL